MIGFELNINGEKISAGIDNSVISIIVLRSSFEFRDSIDF